MTPEFNAETAYLTNMNAASTTSHAANQPSILIADSLPGLRLYASTVVRKVSTSLGQIHEAADGQAAIDHAQRYCPELIIMDVAMPGVNGIKAAAQIWAANPSAKILFWTQYHREVYIRDLTRIVPEQAIHGYVLKNHADDTLIHAITSVWLHDNPYIDPQVRAASKPSQTGGDLTDREFETLQDLALGLTEKAISSRRHISIRGVQCRVAALYSKLRTAGYPRTNQASGAEMFNQRARTLFEAVKRGLIEPETLCAWEKELDIWVSTQYSSR